MASYNTYNAASFVLIIAAIFGILSFFCGWMISDFTGSQGAHVIFTGYGMLDSKFSDFFEGYAYIPLFVLILSVLTLIIAFLPKIGVNVDAGKYSLMLIIIGLAILVLALLYGLHTFDYNLEGLVEFHKNGFESASVGFILAIIAGVVEIIVGALPALTRRL